MLTTLALLSTLTAPGEADGLALKNAHLTYGVLGPTRPNSKFVPGDSLILCFDIEGITVGPDGKVLYKVATEVVDAAGKPVVKPQPRDLEAFNGLGGNRLPAYARLDIGSQQAPGDYILNVTVTDRATGKSATLTQTFSILKPAFGLVRLALSRDPEGETPAGLLGSGEGLWINIAVVGFARDDNKKQPNVAFELRILDENGKPTTDKPMSGVIDKDVPSNANVLPAQFLLPLNRPGKFTLQFTAHDKVGARDADLSFPITVLSPPRP
jgi:hypothetical protein